MDVENVKLLKLRFMIITFILSYNNNNLSKIIIDHKKYDYEIFYPTACITGFVFFDEIWSDSKYFLCCTNIFYVIGIQDDVFSRQFATYFNTDQFGVIFDDTW